MLQQSASYRDSIRWGLLLAAVGVTGFRLPRAVHDFQEWRRALSMESSPAVEAYRAIFLVDVIGVAVVLATGIGLFYFLRVKKAG
jgi:hypothetical protein